METANIVFRLLAASQVLLFFFVLVFSVNPLRVRLVGGVLLSAIIFYFVLPLVFTYTGFSDSIYLWVYPSLIPCFTLLFVWVVFEEHCEIPLWLSVVVLVDVGMSVWHLSVTQINPDWLTPLVISQAFKIAISLVAIFIIWRGRDNDLVELRLRIRWYFIGSVAVTVLAVALVEMFNVYEVPMTGEALGMAWMFILGLVINVSFIRLNPSLELLGRQIPQVNVEHVEDSQINNLLERMRSERLYADHDLRVGSLADIVGIPEYQLRKKINQTLGFRNFNQFVNGYRIEEAGQRLLSEPRTPVLSIALDVGFRSISSFNTAFQAHFSVSPTVYRSQTLTDS